MGNVNENEQIRRLEMHELARHCNLSYEQIDNLWRIFQQLSESKQHDGVIDEEEYMSLFKTRNQFSEQLFHFIDINKDHVLNFREWVEGFSKFKAISNNSRVKLAFQLLSNGTQQIAKQNVVKLLDGLLSELQLNMSQTESAKILEVQWPHAKSELNPSDLKVLMETNPQMLEWLYYELE